jgi:hypothetical protein
MKTIIATAEKKTDRIVKQTFRPLGTTYIRTISSQWLLSALLIVLTEVRGDLNIHGTKYF